MKPLLMRDALKSVLGRYPQIAVSYQRWIARDRHPSAGFDLSRLAAAAPAWASVLKTAAPASGGKRILVMGSLRWWLEYATAMAVLLRAQGHRVDLGYLPYRRWVLPVSRFDAQRQSALIRRSLAPLDQWLGFIDLSSPSDASLPERLEAAIEEQSRLDVQYTLQREDVDWEDGEAHALLTLRRERNRVAAESATALFNANRYDMVIIPNGSILEFGAVYRAAQHAGVPVATFEFGEQRERMWLAQNAEVMRLDTSELWAARGGISLTSDEDAAVKNLYQARRGARLWKNFTRQWQAAESQGAREVREQLRLDPERPLALLCTNVVGDSLALDRQVFTAGMEDWLSQTVRYFENHPETQLVVRVHPGELLGAGHPSVDIVHAALPELPEHVIVVPPESKLNTYDLIELAQFGLVYTTTVGMEMAMTGLPVVVSGATHYRGKGFTYDPDNLDAYFDVLGQLSENAGESRLTEEQVALAWRYAQRFFFEYPFPFPWHLVTFWDDISERSMTQLILDSGMETYQRTLDALVGEEITW